MSVNHKARIRPAAASATQAWRGPGPRLGALGFALLAAGLLIAQIWAPAELRQARLRAAGMILSVADALTKPLDALQDAQARLRDWSGAVEENRQLRLELQALRRQQVPLEALRAENKELRTLATTAKLPARAFLAARVVGFSGGPQQQSVWINAGLEAGIAPDMAVMAPDGLIGRVIEVGPDVARVLLVTDALSRIPVRTAQSRLQAIAAGDHTDRPVLRYLPPRSAPETGEAVLSAGDAHLLPADLPVGVVEQDPADPAAWRIRPLADLGRLDWVSVIDFSYRADAR